jgi:parvulin-like peptidyl-prolyl isomerase
MKKAVLLSLTALITLMFQTAFAKATHGAMLLDRIVATVNSEVITWSELVNTILIEGKPYLEGLSEDVRKKRLKELEKPFLKNLIEMNLQLQAARRMGLNVSENEVKGAMRDIKAKFDMSEEVFMNSIKAEGLTMRDYKSRLADQILLQKVVNFAVKDSIVISDKAIEKYYEDNKGQYGSIEKLKIRQIFFALPTDDSRKASVEKKALDLVNRINKGEDFAKLAEEYSEGPAREFGGDLGYISRGSVLKEIEEAAFAMQPGEVSKPFWSTAGIHIINLEDRIAGGGLEKVSGKIKQALFLRAFEAKRKQWQAGLREKAHIENRL